MREGFLLLNHLIFISFSWLLIALTGMGGLSLTAPFLFLVGVLLLILSYDQKQKINMLFLIWIVIYCVSEFSKVSLFLDNVIISISSLVYPIIFMFLYFSQQLVSCQRSIDASIIFVGIVSLCYLIFTPIFYEVIMSDLTRTASIAITFGAVLYMVDKPAVITYPLSIALGYWMYTGPESRTQVLVIVMFGILYFARKLFAHKLARVLTLALLLLSVGLLTYYAISLEAYGGASVITPAFTGRGLVWHALLERPLSLPAGDPFADVEKMRFIHAIVEARNSHSVFVGTIARSGIVLAAFAVFYLCYVSTTNMSNRDFIVFILLLVNGAVHGRAIMSVEFLSILYLILISRCCLPASIYTFRNWKTKFFGYHRRGEVMPSSMIRLLR